MAVTTRGTGIRPGTIPLSIPGTTPGITPMAGTTAGTTIPGTTTTTVGIGAIIPTIIILTMTVLTSAIIVEGILQVTAPVSIVYTHIGRHTTTEALTEVMDAL